MPALDNEPTADEAQVEGEADQSDQVELPADVEAADLSAVAVDLPEAEQPSTDGTIVDHAQQTLKDFSWTEHPEWISVQGYQGRDYMQIGAYLRHGRYYDEVHKISLDNKVSDIDKLMKIAPALEKPMMVYRGLKSNFELRQWVNELNVGDAWIDPSYVSTTANVAYARQIADQGIMLQIDAPVGTKGINLNQFLGDKSKVTAEEEYLLPRETKLIVTDKHVEQDGTLVISVRIN
jgi:hypothetical protein